MIVEQVPENGPEGVPVEHLFGDFEHHPKELISQDRETDVPGDQFWSYKLTCACSGFRLAPISSPVDHSTQTQLLYLDVFEFREPGRQTVQFQRKQEMFVHHQRNAPTQPHHQNRVLGDFLLEELGQCFPVEIVDHVVSLLETILQVEFFVAKRLFQVERVVPFREELPLESLFEFDWVVLDAEHVGHFRNLLHFFELRVTVSL